MEKNKMYKRVFETYQSFEEWVKAHKHSTPAIEAELELSLGGEEHDLSGKLEAYITSLEALRSEIDSEISEARDWIEYSGKQKG